MQATNFWDIVQKAKHPNYCDVELQFLNSRVVNQFWESKEGIFKLFDFEFIGI